MKENEVLMEKPVCSGFSVIELSKILMYGTRYDELQAYFA